MSATPLSAPLRLRGCQCVRSWLERQHVAADVGNNALEQLTGDAVFHDGAVVTHDTTLDPGLQSMAPEKARACPDYKVPVLTTRCLS